MSRSVIIAENSPAVAKSIAEAFEEHDYKILGMFEDGISALQSAKQSPPSILTLDLILPRLSGLQLAASLGKFEIRPVIIAISAVTARARLAQAKAAGVRYYILKPLANEKLTGVLLRHLESKQGEAQAKG